MHGYWTWHTKRSVPDCRRLGICFVVNWKHECIWQITLFFVRRRKLIESARKKKCLDELSIKIILQRERQNLCTTNTKYVRTWSCSKWIANLRKWSISVRNVFLTNSNHLQLWYEFNYFEIRPHNTSCLRLMCA